MKKMKNKKQLVSLLKSSVNDFNEYIRSIDASSIDLWGVDLMHADLRGADLRGASLTGADLNGANLRDASLRGADIRMACLRDVDLKGADLRNVFLEVTNLEGVNLEGAKGILSFGPMPTSGRTIYCVQHKKSYMVQAGCFWGSLDELEEKVKSTHNCPKYMGIISKLRNKI